MPVPPHALVEPPRETFETLVIDPPWPMTKIERDVRPNQVEFDYPGQKRPCALAGLELLLRISSLGATPGGSRFHEENVRLEPKILQAARQRLAVDQVGSSGFLVR
jgi:hypothetical protein